MAQQRNLGRRTSHRKLMLRNLVTSLLLHGRIETTVTRAKETQKMAEKMITLAKRGDLHARRQVLAYVMNVEEIIKSDEDEKNKKVKEEKAIKVVDKLFNDIAPKYADKNGGYTRIVKTAPRQGDAALMSIIELI